MPIFSLIIAFFALTVNFWAWSLLGPLGPKIASDLSLGPVELSILIAVPILVGSLARIPFGILTDRFGGSKVFSALCFFAILPLIALAYATSYNEFLVAGAFLGLTGAAFVIGIPFVGAWFPPEKRGLVLGLYSMGNAGTAVSGFLTPTFANTLGMQTTFLIVAGTMFIMGAVLYLWGVDSPRWQTSKSALTSLRNASKDRYTWDLSLMYAVSFGAFVAFGAYLPVLLNVFYGLSLTDAAARSAGFVLLATLTRPLGGWLSDTMGGEKVLRIGFAAIAILASFTAFQPTLAITTTITYLSLAAFLGCCNGAIISLISKHAKPDIVGSVTGIVGACGGLGGFVPPLILGLTYQKTQSYSFALLGLSMRQIAW